MHARRITLRDRLKSPALATAVLLTLAVAAHIAIIPARNGRTRVGGSDPGLGQTVLYNILPAIGPSLGFFGPRLR